MSGRFRAECRRIIFKSDRWDEKAFDVVLIWENHDRDATFCKVCGDRLPATDPPPNENG